MDLISTNSFNKPQNQISVFLLVSATGIGVFMGALDGSIVNISLYTIEKYFNITEHAVEWVILAYLLVVIAFTAISGNLGDKYGTKLIFQIGMVIFALGSFVCGFAPSIAWLIGARIFQAIGATGLFANGIAIITHFTDHSNRGKAIGWNSLIVAAALSLGPTLGGVMTQYLGWQSVFFVNVPLGIVGLIYVQIIIPPTPPTNKNKGIDFIGAILFSFSIGVFVYAISLVSPGISLNAVLGDMIFLTVIAIITFLGFIVWSLYKTNPIIDFKLFKNRTFFLGIISAIVAYTILEVVIFQMPFFLQQILNLSPSDAGIVVLGVPIMMAIVGPLAGRRSDKIDPKYLTTLGMGGMCLLIIILGLTLNASTSPLLILLLLFAFGVSIAFFTSANGNCVMSSAFKTKLGLAGGLLALARNIGFSLGISISTAFFIILKEFFAQTNGGSVNDINNYVPAFQFMLLITGIYAIIGIFLTYFRGSFYYKDGKKPPVENTANVAEPA